MSTSHYQKTHRLEILTRRRQHYVETRDVQLAQRRLYVQANKEKIAKKTREKNFVLRNEVFMAYGNKCACCNESFLDYLELDHIHNDGVTHRKSIGMHRSAGPNFYKYLKEQNYPDYIQLLCSNCHRTKTRKVPCPPHY